MLPRPPGGQGHRALPRASFSLGVPVGTGAREPSDFTLKVGPTFFSATAGELPHLTEPPPPRARQLTAKSMLMEASRGHYPRAHLVAPAPYHGANEPPRPPAQPFCSVLPTEPAKGWSSQLGETGHQDLDSRRKTLFYVPVPQFSFHLRPLLRLLHEMWLVNCWACLHRSP